MPVIVIGADGPGGPAIAASLAADGADVRAFVSDSSIGDDLRALGVKVATGDLSDRSHVAAAATGAFCAVVVGDGVSDGRALAFAATPGDALDEIATAIGEAGVRRIIWVGSGSAPASLEAASGYSGAVASGPGIGGRDVAASVLALESAPREEGP